MLPAYLEIPNELRTAAIECFARAAHKARQVRCLWQPGTRRGLLLRLVVGLWLTLALIIFLAMAVERTGTSSPVAEVADYLLPGHSLPKAASCDNDDHGRRHLSYCMAFQAGGDPVRFTYDLRKEVIRSTSLPVEGITIGDLILAWGTPTGYRHDYGTIEIFWREKSALTSTPLNPTSQVRFILYHLDASDLPQDRLGWRGFVTLDK